MSWKDFKGQLGIIRIPAKGADNKQKSMSIQLNSWNDVHITKCDSTLLDHLQGILTRRTHIQHPCIPLSHILLPHTRLPHIPRAQI